MSKILVGLSKEGAILTECTSVRLASKLVAFGNVQVRVYSIGHMALALHRSTATIRRWQRKKIIPPPLVKTKDGARWYLKEELELYKRLVMNFNITTGVSIEETGFVIEVHGEIQALGKKLTETLKKGETK